MTTKDLSKTSRNIIPKLLRKVEVDGKSVLNYGAGRFYKRTETYLLEQGANLVYSYDPFVEDIVLIPIMTFDVVLLTNVLNVIEDGLERFQAVINCMTLSKDGTVMFDFYAKDGTGIGSDTKDGWQANMSLKHWKQWMILHDITMEQNSNKVLELTKIGIDLE